MSTARLHVKPSIWEGAAGLAEAALRLRRRSAQAGAEALDCAGHPRASPLAGPRASVEGSVAAALASRCTLTRSAACRPVPLDKGTPGDSAEIVGEAFLCTHWLAASRGPPGGGPGVGPSPPAMPPHGFPPRTTPTTTAPMLLVWSARKGSRSAWAVVTTAGLMTRSRSTTRMTAGGGGQDATKEGPGAAGRGPMTNAVVCVSTSTFGSGLTETHGPRLL